MKKDDAYKAAMNLVRFTPRITLMNFAFKLQLIRRMDELVKYMQNCLNKLRIMESPCPSGGQRNVLTNTGMDAISSVSVRFGSLQWITLYLGISLVPCS